MIKLEFGKYTDITNFAKSVSSEMYGMYEKIYICPDTNNWWISLIQEGYDEDYEPSPGTYLIERNNPEYPNGGRLPQIVLTRPDGFIKDVLLDWDGSCWDNYEADSLEEAIEVVDGGYGIIPEEA